MSASAESPRGMNGAASSREKAIKELQDWIPLLPHYTEKRGSEDNFARKWIHSAMKICPYERAIKDAFAEHGYAFVESLPSIDHEAFSALITEEIAEFRRNVVIPKSEPPANSDEAMCLAVVQEINRTHFQTSVSGRPAIFRESYDAVVGRKVYEEMSLTAFDANHENRFLEYTDSHLNRKVRKTVAKIWREHPSKRQYEGVGFDPSEKMPQNYFNLWTGLSMVPKKGDWSETRKFLLNVICAGKLEHYEYLIRWCARMIQFPGEPAGTCVVLMGKRGTGKGTFASILRSFLSVHSLQIQSRDQLVGRFNGHLETTVCLIVDESFFAGNKEHENTLKALITEPVLTFEDKGRRAKAGRNCLHIVMLTNDDWAIPAGEDERRYFVMRVSDAHAQDTEYFSELRKRLAGGEAEAMLHDLAEMDLSAWDVFKLPRSGELVDQKDRNLRKEARWLRDVLNSGKIGFAEWASTGLEISKREMWDAYAEDEKKRGERYPVPFSPWAKKITEILGNCISEGMRKAVKQANTHEGKTVLRPRTYELKSLGECRKAFAAWLKSPELEWGLVEMTIESTQGTGSEAGGMDDAHAIFD